MSGQVEDQIRVGLRLLAEDVQPPTVMRVSRRPRGRLVAIAAGLALLAAAAAVGIVGRGGSPTGPRFISDGFDYLPGAPSYKPGGVFTPSPPALSYSVPILAGVAAGSERAAWIVGSVDQRGTSWRWNGTTWRNVPLPPLPGQVELYSVATAPDGEAWAVGWHSEPADYLVAHALVEHWDGERWRVAAIPDHGSSNLLSVSASGPRDVWAVGESFQRDRRGKFPARGTHPLLIHWDGSSWSTVALPWAHPGLDDGAKVVAIAPTDVWVVISGTQVEHWDGQSWQAVPAPFGSRDPLLGFSATSPSDAWAVGSYRQGRHSRTLAAHWDGQSWQIAPTPNRSTESTLTDVVAVRPDDVWAVGQSEWLEFLANGGVKGKEAVGLFEHWDGRSWKVMRGVTPPMWDGVPVLAATVDGAAFAVGSCYFDNVLTRWSGSAWQISRHPPDQHPPRAKWATCSSPAAGG